MSPDRLEGKIRNAIRIMEEEVWEDLNVNLPHHAAVIWDIDLDASGKVPIMKKVSAHMKKTKSEL